MSPQAIGKASSTNAAAIRPTTTKNFNDLQSEDFFGLLIAQLQSQDPLKPTDNQTLLNQMSSIRQMEQSSTLTNTLNSLAAEQRFGSASSLIGQYVSGTFGDSNSSPTTVAGVVTSVRFEDSGRAILELHNGGEIPAEKVDLVTLVENLPDEIRQRILTETDGADLANSKTLRAVKPGVARLGAKPAQPIVAPEKGLITGLMESLFGAGATAGVSV
ncbi:MAG: flagellar hook capping FlgD N-terminal domain-containing protein [Planctomycetota bacterium]